MNIFKGIIGFIFSLVLSVGILFVVSLFYFLGSQYCAEVELQKFDWEIFCFFGIFSIIYAFFSLFFIKIENKKGLGFGIFLPLLLTLFLTGSAGIDLLSFERYYTKFDSNIWKKDTYHDVKMARILIKEKTLIKLTKEEVKELLGESEEIKNNKYIYHIHQKGYGPTSLHIVFINNNVNDVYFECFDD
ncbi:MAG: hypothetical protein GY827_08080 [Cytophagales bacterium]|nr:hypothetical protein [Cytophagales bacterium]